MTGKTLAIALATLGVAGPAAAQSMGEFAGAWVFGTEVTPFNGGQRYVHGVMAATHDGGDRYSILLKAYEPIWGGTSPGINYAQQQCIGIVTNGASMTITCTVDAGSAPGYHPDRFTLTRGDRLAWQGAMPIGNTSQTMRVIVSKVS